MVSTLRITSVVVIFLAAVVVGLVAGPSSLIPNLLAGFALRSDPEIERILNEPSVVELYIKKHGNTRVGDQDTTSPLVKQAEAFKNIIDPPPAPPSANSGGKPSSVASRTGKPVVKPVVSSAQFDLVGTTVSGDYSFAYIRLPDKTYRWARKGDVIGHLTIKEIHNGSIICSDGRADIPMVTEPVPDTASLLEVAGPSVVPTDSHVAPPGPTAGRITGQPVARPWGSVEPATPGRGEVDGQEREEALDLIRQMRELRQGDAAATDVNLSPEEANRLIAELKSSRVSPEEAEKVEDLGRELNESAEPSPADKLRDMRRKLTIPRTIRK
ncbi:MAG TPA: hypothetical protein PLU87_07660 [Sedimentisphaerales bacterium]|nr:hypothetical protein [Sedimentisphaerales bacterium]HRS10654.1 hypothetical protein [Sedimentisphaerales bacterium]HRV47359.1 hypothetical protein [Sedimentisphaerales bacterium]